MNSDQKESYVKGNHEVTEFINLIPSIACLNYKDGFGKCFLSDKYEPKNLISIRLNNTKISNVNQIIVIDQIVKVNNHPLNNYTSIFFPQFLHILRYFGFKLTKKCVCDTIHGFKLTPFPVFKVKRTNENIKVKFLQIMSSHIILDLSKIVLEYWLQYEYIHNVCFTIYTVNKTFPIAIDIDQYLEEELKN